MKYAPLIASRGCPYDSTFCSGTQMFGRKYRIKDADLVMEEVMKRYSEGFGHGAFSTTTTSLQTRAILAPIPSTQLYDQMKGANRIYINDWD